MKKFLIVQPHSDDALFSAFTWLLKHGQNTEVLTVENNDKRVAEDVKLYEFLNIPYSHLSVSFDDQSFYDFHKKYSEVTEDNALEHLINYFGADKVAEIKDAIVETLEKKVDKETQIIVPWGIGHPFHLFVRIAIEQEYDDLIYYREFPHSYKRRAQSQVKRQLESFNLFKIIETKSIEDIKWSLARKYYKSQSGLLWFEQGYIKKHLSEEFYKRK